MAIHINPAHKGMLHSDTHTPQGSKISLSKLMMATRSKDPAVRKRAQFAENARKWNHGK